MNGSINLIRFVILIYLIDRELREPRDCLVDIRDLVELRDPLDC